jgi:hypothetical protein
MSLIIPDKIENAFRIGKSENTIKTYKSMVLKLFRECFNTENFSIKLLQDTKKVIKYLDKLSTTSIKIITIAVVMLLKAAVTAGIPVPKELINIYGKMARHTRIKDLKERQGRPITEAEEDAFIPWSEIINIRTQYKKQVNDKKYVETLTDLEYQRLFMRYLVLCLYTYIPPQRGQVYFNCYIDKKIKGSNHIDTKSGILHITEHKTMRSYGDRKIQLPTALIQLIKDWKTITNCRSSLLLCNSQGEMMSTQSYTQLLNSIFESGMSTDMIRKVYTSHMINDIGISEKQRVELALLMGHSRSVQESFYNKKEF